MYIGSVHAETTSCNAYLTTLDAMSLRQLIEELKLLATAWRRTPRRARGFHDRVVCRGLTTTINQRFGVCYYILATPGSPHNYQVYPPAPPVR